MVLLVLLVHVLSASPPPPPCATSCTHAHCDNFNIRYGTYCGVGYTGCPGVKPCDAYDACCETHDACVTTESMMSQKCHAALTRCLHTALANHTTTWIEERGESATGCSAEEIVKTMSNGMGVASLFSLFMGGAQHQPAAGHLAPHGSNVASAHGALGRPSLASTSMRFEGSHSSRYDELHARIEKIKSRQAATRRKLTDRPWVGKRRTRELAEEAQGTESTAVENGARSNPNPNPAGVSSEIRELPEVSHSPTDQARELRDQP